MNSLDRQPDMFEKHANSLEEKSFDNTGPSGKNSQT